MGFLKRVWASSMTGDSLAVVQEGALSPIGSQSDLKSICVLSCVYDLTGLIAIEQGQSLCRVQLLVAPVHATISTDFDIALIRPVSILLYSTHKKHAVIFALPGYYSILFAGNVFPAWLVMQ